MYTIGANPDSFGAPGSDSYHFIDTEDGIKSLIHKMVGLRIEPPSLYIDCRGSDLSRKGFVSVMQIYIAPTDEVYLVDVLALGARAFTTPDPSFRVTLQAVLENVVVPKVVFDARRISDVLHGIFGIRLGGVQDVQLMEMTQRPFEGSPRSFSICVARDLMLNMEDWAAWTRVEEAGCRLFQPSWGGSPSVFNQRPLCEGIKVYCVEYVRFIWQLWVTYWECMSDLDWFNVLEWSKRRVEESQSTNFWLQSRNE